MYCKQVRRSLPKHDGDSMANAGNPVTLTCANPTAIIGTRQKQHSWSPAAGHRLILLRSLRCEYGRHLYPYRYPRLTDVLQQVR